MSSSGEPSLDSCSSPCASSSAPGLRSASRDALLSLAITSCSMSHHQSRTACGRQQAIASHASRLLRSEVQYASQTPDEALSAFGLTASYLWLS